MLKNIFKTTSALDKQRYEIEKSFNQQLKSEYASLDKLNKAYDALTQKSEKIFEQKERTFVKDKKHHDQLYTKSLEDFEANNTKTINDQEAILNTLSTKQKEQLEALKLDYKKSLLVAQEERQELTQEKTLALKEIEKKFSEDIAIFEDKLNLFKKNLRENQQKTEKRLSNSLDTLLKKSRDESIITPLLNDLKLTTKELKENLVLINKDKLKEQENTTKKVQKTITETRKVFNQLFKEINHFAADMQSSFNEPLLTIEQTLKKYIETINTKTESFMDSVNKDFDLEETRLNRLIEDDSYDSKYVKEFKSRAKLYNERKQVLNTNAIDLSKFLLKDIDTLLENLSHMQTLIKDTFKTQDDLFKTCQQYYKTEISLLENTLKEISKKSKEVSPQSHIEKHLTLLETFYETLYKHLAHFEQSRVSAVIEFGRAAVPKIKQIDEISMFLDTVEPLKEVRINEVKQQIEQENFSLRFDIKFLKIEHEKELKTIEHDLRILETKHLSSIKYDQETHKLKTLKAKALHEKSVLEYEYKTKESELIYALRQNQIEHDKSILNERQSIDTKKLELEHHIEALTAEKEYQLNQVEIDKEMAEKTAQIRSSIEHEKNALQLNLEKQKQQTKQVETHYKAVYKEREMHYDDALNKLEIEIEKSKQAQHEKLLFIDRALEKEKIKPEAQIKEVESLKNHRITRIKSTLKPLVDTLNTSEIALKKTSPELKQLLTIISKPFIRQVDETLSSWMDIFEESHSFITQVTLKQINNDQELTEKRKQLKLKAESQNLEKTQKQLKKQKDLLHDALIVRLQEARTLITEEKNQTLLNIKQVLSPLISLLKERLIAESSSILEEISRLFKTLYQPELDMIKHFKEQHTIAKDQAIAQFEKELKPLEKKKEELLSKKQDALTEVESLKEKALQTKIAPFEKDLALIRENIKRLDKEKTTIEKSFKDSLNDLKISLDKEKTRIKELFENRIKERHTHYEQKKTKLQEKLKDAKNILEYESKIHQNELEHHENILQDTLENLENDIKQQISIKQNEITALKTKKATMIKTAQESLMQKNQDLEDAIMQSSSRIDASIEHVSRDLQQEAMLKEKEKNRLIEQLRHLENQLNLTLSKALDDLQTHVNQLIDESFKKAKESTDNIPVLFKNIRKDWYQALMENTKSIISQPEK